MERHFERELDELKDNLVRMGSLVDGQLDAACGYLTCTIGHRWGR